ncbi:MAG: hypothetical protein A3I66_05585 [Burkholderiales bacterium RIFCSPLOWO2_02_FULL_57_36]|nr:MAG: hypothetical protein A3I66_05585 [Burkholderiales bacterium RIFCSPLOWO2_02_FULL_57_36]
MPDASRTVYKCKIDGKVSYSDAPCLGAERIDIEPTRGMNKSTGRELTGSDVSRERHREMMSDALKPLTGMSAQQFNTQSRRMKLPAGARSECTTLDGRISDSEARERAATTDTKPAVERNLLEFRKRYQELGC